MANLEDREKMDSEAAHPTTAHAARASGAGASGAGGEKAAAVLVVEPDPELQSRLARMLTVRGHRVVGTSSGDGALALVRQWPVDLVLVDDALPATSALSSLALARVLRAVHPGVRVVLMTGASAHAEVHLAARLAGVVACLTKPFRPETIVEALRLLAPRVAGPGALGAAG